MSQKNNIGMILKLEGKIDKILEDCDISNETNREQEKIIKINSTDKVNDIIEIKVINTLFRVKKTGEIERQMRSGNWKFIKNSPNHNQGYNVILVDKKQIMRSRIIAYAFMGIELFNKKNIIFHKDDNRLNCNVENLSIQTRKTINYYRNSKGYYYDKYKKMYIPIFTHNGISKKLKPCETEEEAHLIYKTEKQKYMANV